MLECGMPLLTSILLLLVVSRVFGELMSRLKQPSIVGEILSGVLLGPAILGLIKPTEHLAGIAELSVFLIVLQAGLEMNFSSVVRALLGRGIVISLLSFFIPLTGGTLLGLLYRETPIQALFLGLCMAITALPVAVRILDNFKLLDSIVSRYAVSTAILNDVCALLLLGVALDRPVEGGLVQTILFVLSSAGKMLVFALLVYLASRLLQWGARQTIAHEWGFESLSNLFGKEALFGVVVLFVLLFGSVAENLGSHFVIGAFFGGLLLNKDFFGERRFQEVENVINSITSGFLAPLFFGFLGLHFRWSALHSPGFLFLVLAIAMATKILAGYWGGLLLKLKHAEAIGIGIILNGRGVMELVVANIALQRGFIGEETFSTLVLMGIVTTLLTPILFRRFALPHLLPI